MVHSKQVPAGALAIPTEPPASLKSGEDRAKGGIDPHPYASTKDSGKETMGREVVSPGYDDIATPQDDYEPEAEDLVKAKFKLEGPPEDVDNDAMFEKRLAEAIDSVTKAMEAETRSATRAADSLDVLSYYAANSAGQPDKEHPLQTNIMLDDEESAIAFLIEDPETNSPDLEKRDFLVARHARVKEYWNNRNRVQSPTDDSVEDSLGEKRSEETEGGEMTSQEVAAPEIASLERKTRKAWGTWEDLHLGRLFNKPTAGSWVMAVLVVIILWILVLPFMREYQWIIALGVGIALVGHFIYQQELYSGNWRDLGPRIVRNTQAAFAMGLARVTCYILYWLRYEPTREIMTALNAYCLERRRAGDYYMGYPEYVPVRNLRPRLDGEEAARRREARIKVVARRLTKLGTLRHKHPTKIKTRDVNTHLWRELDENDQQLAKLLNANIAEIRAHTPLFGRRPYCKMVVNGVVAKLLFDTGAQLCAFNRDFLEKLTDSELRPLRKCGEMVVQSYLDAETQLLKEVTMHCPGYPKDKTVVKALQNDRNDKGYNGILGTNVMATFRMTITWPSDGQDVIITHRPKHAGPEVPMQAIITEEDDMHPVEVQEIHKPIRKSTGVQQNTVVLEELLTAVPGKKMTVKARICNFSRQLKNSYRGITFEPYDGFADVLLRGHYPAGVGDRIEVVVHSPGDLVKSDSALKKQQTKDLLEAGVSPAKLLPQNWKPGTAIGVAKPYNDTSEVHVNELLHDFANLGMMHTEECTCKYYRDQEKYIVVHFGDKNGFNYSNKHQFLKPGEEVKSDYQKSAYSMDKNVISFKRHAIDDRYDIDFIKMPKILDFKKKVVVIFPYREQISPGQQRALSDLRQIAGDIHMVKHRSEKCRDCSTLASYMAWENDETQLLSNFNNVVVSYSMDGTIQDQNLNRRDARVGEARFKISGVATLQVYRDHGDLHILVHMQQSNAPHLMHAANQLTYAQAYLFNQFRILRVPRSFEIKVSWPVDENRRDPRNSVVNCIAGLDLWEPQNWGRITPTLHRKEVHRMLPKCYCWTCNRTRKGEEVPIHKFYRAFTGDPANLAEGARVVLDLPAGFDVELNEQRRKGEAAGQLLNYYTHRSLVTSAAIKHLKAERNPLICQIGLRGEAPVLSEAERTRPHRQEIERAAMNVLNKLASPAHMQRPEKAPPDPQRLELRRALGLPVPHNSFPMVTELAVPRRTPRADWEASVMKVAADHEEPEVKWEVKGMPERLQEPAADFKEALAKAEDTISQTSTDLEVEEHVNTAAGEFDKNTIVGQRHQLGVPWRDHWDPEASPKKPEVRKRFEEIMDRYNDVFSKTKYAWRLMDIPPVKIPFKQDADPVVHKYIPMNPIEDFILTKKIDELVANDLLRVVAPDQNVFRSITRLFLVKHNSKSGEILKSLDRTDLDEIDTNLYRIVADFRALNGSILNAGFADYVMGSPQEVVARMGGYSYFIGIDLKAAYRSVPVDEETKNQMTLRADTKKYRNSLLQFQSLVDGIAVAPQIFTQVVLDAIEEYSDNTVVWVDDITIYAKTAEKALDVLEGVLGKLEKIGALVALNKMQLTLDFDENGPSEPQVFSHMGFDIKTVSVEDPDRPGKYKCTPKLCISDTKRQIFGSMKIPTRYKDVQMALGCANWISNFIPYHQPRMDPFIQKLTKGKEKTWKPDQAMQTAWSLMLYLIQTAPDLTIIDYTRKLYIISDASIRGCGAQMHQFVDGVANLLGYYSKRFKLEWGTHHKYSSVFREVLGLDYACQHWKSYIYACVKTVLTVDISSVVHMASARFIQDDSHLCRVMSRITMLGTSFKLRHRPAKKSPIPDVLSRNPGGETEPVTEDVQLSFGRTLNCEVHKNTEGGWEHTATGVPVEHVHLTNDWLSKVPNGLPAAWLDEKKEIEMEDMMAHLCEQIGRDESLTARQATTKYKHLLQNCHEKYAPIVREWQLRQGVADVNTATVGTLHVREADGRTVRMACVRLTDDQQRELEEWDERNNASGRIHNINYADYEEEGDQPLSMKCFDRGFYVRLQDMNPEIRRIKQEILQKNVEELNVNHQHFRLENHSLLVSCKKKELGFKDPTNRRIYLGEKQALYMLFQLHQAAGHMGINATRAFFANYFDTGSIKTVVDIVAKSCAACILYNPTRARISKKGRLPRSLEIGHKAYVDVANIDVGYTKDILREDRRKTTGQTSVDHILVIQESYSGRTIIVPILGQTKETLAEALKHYQSTQIPLTYLHADNATDFTSPEFLEMVRPYGIEGISFSSPYSPYSNARVERFINSLRAVAWKMVQHNNCSSLWYVLHEANAILNRRPCRELKPYLDYPGLPPSRDDLYYGLAPRNLEHNLEAALGHVPMDSRSEQRAEYIKLIDAYEKDMNAILEKANDGVEVTHVIKPGDYVVLADHRRMKTGDIARGIPKYTTGRIYRVEEVINGRQAKLKLVLGDGTRRNQLQRLDQCKKVAAPHALKYMPDEIRRAYGTPFTHEDLEQMSIIPPQFVKPCAKADKAVTRSDKAQLFRKKKVQFTGTTEVPKVKDAASQSSSDSSLGDGDPASSQGSEEDVIAIENWAEEVDDLGEPLRENSDPRLSVKKELIGDKEDSLRQYFAANGAADADARARALFKGPANRTGSSAATSGDGPVGRTGSSASAPGDTATNPGSSMPLDPPTTATTDRPSPVERPSPGRWEGRLRSGAKGRAVKRRVRFTEPERDANGHLKLVRAAPRCCTASESHYTPTRAEVLSLLPYNTRMFSLTAHHQPATVGVC